jgi:hypothetical protein
MKTLDLTAFDGKLIDGLRFCRKVYDLFEHIKSEADGVRRLRLRPSITEKRLVEELIPLARYVQARYREATGSEGRVEIESAWAATKRGRAAGQLAPAVELPDSSQNRCPVPRHALQNVSGHPLQGFLWIFVLHPVIDESSIAGWRGRTPV